MLHSGMARPNWDRQGRDWPNRPWSRFVEAGGLRWHVQEAGQGPDLLLLHGTGASTHSFRDLLPLLAQNFRVVAPDLPGQGFTGMPARPDGLSLKGMADRIHALCTAMDFSPRIAAGHSAGAALLVAMAVRNAIRPRAIVALNGALMPIEGVALLGPLAKLLFLNPVVPRLFAWRGASETAVRRLLEGTGSRLDPRGIELYRRLFSTPGHVAGTLGMMANWEPGWLKARFAALDATLFLVTGARDKAVSPADAAKVAAMVRRAQVIAVPSGGHLLHEEEPARIAAIIEDAARDTGVLPGATR